MDVVDKIFEALTYNSASPLIFTSGEFLFILLGFLAIYSFLRKQTLPRIAYVAAFSLYFYYKTSGIFFLLLLYTATSDFLIAHFMARVKQDSYRKALLVLSLLTNLGMLFYFKYTNFFIDLYNSVAENPLDFQNIFLPIGISFFTFQSLSYTIDVYRRRIEPLTRWIDYVFYVSFFVQLVAGPIVRARDFIPQIRRNPISISRSDFGRGVFLIAIGLFKKAVVSDYIASHFVDMVFGAPSLYSSFENIMAVYGYALQIYCDFSGYSDIAIGLALLLGFHFNINFNSPYKSATITEFWRRWHISLSSWLKDYLYISLGGNRKGRVRTYFNLLLTMLLGGLWHGASLRFVVWGAMHGIALAVHKFVMGLLPSAFPKEGSVMPRWRRIIGIVLTFNFVCVAWVFFRASSFEVAVDMFSQIFAPVSGEYFTPWESIVGFKAVFAMMAVGYVLHFASQRSEQWATRTFEKLPMVFYPLVLCIVIWAIIQLRDGNAQAFIYFQF